MCALDRGQVVLRLGGVQLSGSAGLGGDHRWNCSSNGDDVGATMGVPVAVCSASVSAPVSCAQQLPLPHSSESDL